MLDYTSLYDQMNETALAPWLTTLPAAVSTALAPDSHGKMSDWLDALAALPTIAPQEIELRNEVRVENAAVSDETRRQIAMLLRRLHPWRKGPFDIHGVRIDTEWRSDWKWERVRDAISPLDGRRVLDVGCGNGYYGWRMLGKGARLVIGLDPFLLYVMQYHAVRHFVGAELPNYVLPLGIEALPEELEAFDTIFSMGVLYHRRSPFDHLLRLRDALRGGGELVIETLVIVGAKGEVLVPEGRYAQMRNVWFIPSPTTLVSWLKKVGFERVKLVDISPTTTAEQRTTDWMTFHSLKQFLDPNDETKTIEGHPAPVRAVLTAVKS